MNFCIHSAGVVLVRLLLFRLLPFRLQSIAVPFENSVTRILRKFACPRVEVGL